MTAEINLAPSYRLVTLDRVDSTNEEAKRRAAAGAPAGTLVWAREQTAGRARRGRRWSSPPGNLYCSLLLRPEGPAARALQLSFVAAVALAEAVAGLLPAAKAVECKWPNDVLIDGRKVAGILLEGTAADGDRLEWLVVGAGVNVAGFPAATEFPATSLRAEGYAGADVGAVLEAFAEGFARWVATWQAEGFGAVRAAWLGRARGLGAPLTVRLERETLEGTFCDLDADGALVLKAAAGCRRITSGDVFFPAA